MDEPPNDPPNPLIVMAIDLTLMVVRLEKLASESEGLVQAMFLNKARVARSAISTSLSAVKGE